MVVLDSRVEDQAYRGWGLNLVKLDRNGNASIVNLHDHDPGVNHRWIAWIDDCDIDHDGKADLVSIRIGEDELYFIDRPRLFLWRNSTNWWWEAPGVNKNMVHVNDRQSYFISSRNYCHKLIFNENWRKNVDVWLGSAMHEWFDRHLCRRLFSQE